jgi:phage terminase small subunit
MTPKQEAFALAYVETGNASEAYRRAYDVGEDTSNQVIWNEASKVLANHYVSVRVMELQEAAQERCIVTIESLTKELDEDRTLAREEKQPSAAITAVMGKAKLHGLVTDKKELTGKDGKPLEINSASENEAARAIAFLLTMATRSTPEGE